MAGSMSSKEDDSNPVGKREEIEQVVDAVECTPSDSLNQTAHVAM